LLIRTGAELRLSDLLGWDSGYAELIFSEKMWPDFDGEDLRAAVEDYLGRERRFGALSPGGIRQVAAGSLNGG
jgi:undecaprenyl diphosphate synthase